MHETFYDFIIIEISVRIGWQGEQKGMDIGHQSTQQQTTK
jgi:hypothetical protein